jgi:membrane protease subunit HflK
VLDRLIDLILQSLSFLVPFAVVDQYEEAIVLRFGKFHRQLEPGFHWIWPLRVERVILDNVVPRTVNLGAQSLTTLDGKSIVVAGVVTARIRDVKKATLEVESVDHALRDSCYGAIGMHVSGNTWAHLCTEESSEALSKACLKLAWRYGIEIEKVQLSDLTYSKSLALHITNNLGG